MQETHKAGEQYKRELFQVGNREGRRTLSLAAGRHHARTFSEQGVKNGGDASRLCWPAFTL